MSTSSSKRDPCWEYVTLKDPKNKNNTTCNFCGGEYKGGINRAKQHLVGGFPDVRDCDCVPDEIKEKIGAYMANKKQTRENRVLNQSQQQQRIREETLRSYGNEVDGDDEEGLSHVLKKQKKITRGPMDSFVSHGGASTAKDMKKQKSENDDAIKMLRNKACSSIARWFYDAGLPFNAANYVSFQEAVTDIGNVGPTMKAPTLHELRVPLLKKEVDAVNKVMEDHRQEWKKYGCSLMSDGWKDRRERTLINFLVNCSKGSMFLKSVDASDYSKTGEKICELLSQVIEEVGPENVVQVITDNASNMKCAGEMLMAKYKHLYWTPCAAHCLDLILEDLFNIPRLKKVFQKAMKVNSYIYDRSGLVNLMRKFTTLDLVRPAKTRFATAFLTLSRYMMVKKGLRSMFLSESWNNSKWAKEEKGKRAMKTILDARFWSGVKEAIHVAEPLFKVLRLVDGEAKAPMGYIYEAMDRAKEKIAKNFEYREEDYRQFYDIIDARWDTQLHHPLHAAGYYLNPEFFYTNDKVDAEIMDGFIQCVERLVPSQDIQDKIMNELDQYKNAKGRFGSEIAIRQRKTMPPAVWWGLYGGNTPELQKFAIKITSLTCSASGCERNWSFFEHIHSKKRNRLDQKRLNDLVYVKYNRALRRRYQQRDSLDPIILDHLDESTEWYTNGDDDDSVTVIREDGQEEMFGGGLTWKDLSEHCGAEERAYTLRENSRNSTVARGNVVSSSSSKQKTTKVGTSQPSKKSKPSSRVQQAFQLHDEDEDEDDEVDVELLENANKDDKDDDDVEMVDIEDDDDESD